MNIYNLFIKAVLTLIAPVSLSGFVEFFHSEFATQFTRLICCCLCSPHSFFCYFTHNFFLFNCTHNEQY